METQSSKPAEGFAELVGTGLQFDMSKPMVLLFNGRDISIGVKELAIIAALRAVQTGFGAEFMREAIEDAMEMAVVKRRLFAGPKATIADVPKPDAVPGKFGQVNFRLAPSTKATPGVKKAKPFAWRAQKDAKGLCHHCDKKAVDGKKFCRKHYREMSARLAKIRARKGK